MISTRWLERQLGLRGNWRRRYAGCSLPPTPGKSLKLGGYHGERRHRWKVRARRQKSENFHGYIPAESLSFIIRNYRILAPMGALEAAWLDAYVHSSHFYEHGLSVVKSVFDACNRDRLCMLKPLGEALTFEKEGRLTLFRGCAGPAHSVGMSWTPSLDKAIWYAAHHVEYYDLANPTVYVATVPMAENLLPPGPL